MKIHPFLIPGICRTPWVKYAVEGGYATSTEGIFNRRNSSLALVGVSVTTESTLLGRLLGYGSVLIVGDGGAKQEWRNVPSPHLIHEHLLSLSRGQQGSFVGGGEVTATSFLLSACALLLFCSALVAYNVGGVIRPSFLMVGGAGLLWTLTEQSANESKATFKDVFWGTLYGSAVIVGALIGIDWIDKGVDPMSVSDSFFRGMLIKAPWLASTLVFGASLFAGSVVAMFAKFLWKQLFRQVPR